MPLFIGLHFYVSQGQLIVLWCGISLLSKAPQVRRFSSFLFQPLLQDALRTNKAAIDINNYPYQSHG